MLPFVVYSAAHLLLVAVALPLERDIGDELRRPGRMIPDLQGVDAVRDTLGPSDSQYAGRGELVLISGTMTAEGPWKNSASSQQGDEGQKRRTNVGRAVGYHKSIKAREIPLPNDPSENWPQDPSEGPGWEPTDIEQSQSTSPAGQAKPKGEKQHKPAAKESPEHRAALSEATRNAWATKTPEEKEETLQKMQEGWAKRSPEQRAATSKKRKESWANKTPEEKAAISRKKQEGWANRSPERKAATSKLRSDLTRELDAKRSPEEKAATGREKREGWLNRSPEEKAATSKLRSDITQELNAKRSPEEKAEIARKKKETWAKKSEEEQAAITQKRLETNRGKSPEQRAASKRKGKGETLREILKDVPSGAAGEVTHVETEDANKPPAIDKFSFSLEGRPREPIDIRKGVDSKGRTLRGILEAAPSGVAGEVTHGETGEANKPPSSDRFSFSLEGRSREPIYIRNKVGVESKGRTLREILKAAESGIAEEVTEQKQTRKKKKLSPEHRAALSQAIRSAWAKKTPEEKAGITQKRLETLARDPGAKRSPEEKAATAQKKKETWANKSPEEIEAFIEKRLETMGRKSAEEIAASNRKREEKRVRTVRERKAAKSGEAGEVKVTDNSHGETGEANNTPIKEKFGSSLEGQPGEPTDIGNGVESKGRTLREIFRAAESGIAMEVKEQGKTRKTRQLSPEHLKALQQARRNYQANQSPEQKAAAAKQKQEHWANKPPEELTNHGAKVSKGMRQGAVNRSPEEIAASTQRRKEMWAKKTPEEMKVITQKRKDSKRETDAKKSPEEKEASRRKIKQTLANKTPEERAASAQKRLETFANKTPEEIAEINRKREESRRRTLREKKAAKSGNAGEVTDGSHSETGKAKKPPPNDKFSINTGDRSWMPGGQWKEYWSRFLKRVSLPFAAARNVHDNQGGLYFPALPRVPAAVF
ncbi:MAG: hypothetical protein M1816_001725 [Peltula sp. TS41687]|nr:MAG: hypothetical protein M1816_001725 [Peltula sp. TS41687]